MKPGTGLAPVTQRVIRAVTEALTGAVISALNRAVQKPQPGRRFCQPTPSLIMPSGSSLRSKAEILLVVVTLFWGATFVIVKEALNDASPLVFIAGRFTVAGILLWFAVGERKLKRKSLGPALALGALLFVGYIFQTWGQEYTTPSKCAFITGFSVVLVPLIVAAMGAPLRPANAAGALLGLAGIFSSPPL